MKKAKIELSEVPPSVTSHEYVYSGEDITDSKYKDRDDVNNTWKLLPATRYTTAWTPIYCRLKTTGEKVAYDEFNHDANIFYLDEAVMQYASQKTAAVKGTWEAAFDKALKPALVAAGFMAIAAFAVMGVFNPEVFTKPWDDGFSKIFTVGCEFLSSLKISSAPFLGGLCLSSRSLSTCC